MAWIGKVGVGILGLLVGGPVGALIGSALGHQFDHPHALRLPDAVGAVGGLVLDCRVPPAVEVDDVRGACSRR